jgi:hypothetical protein
LTLGSIPDHPFLIIRQLGLPALSGRSSLRELSVHHMMSLGVYPNLLGCGKQKPTIDWGTAPCGSEASGSPAVIPTLPAHATT